MKSLLKALLVTVVMTASVVAKVHEAKSLDHLQSLLDKNENVVVKFYAPWCGPCKQFNPNFEKVAKELKAQVTFVSVDGDKHQDIMEEYGIGGFPTVLYFKNGNKIGKGSKRDVNGFRKEVESKFGL